jgi:hypothetical protein
VDSADRLGRRYLTDPSLTWLAACSLCDRFSQAFTSPRDDPPIPADPNVYSILGDFLEEEAVAVVSSVRVAEGCFAYNQGRTGKAPTVEYVKAMCSELRDFSTTLRMDVDVI